VGDWIYELIYDYTYPFLFFWKNVRTTNTWKPLNATISRLSIIENQIIRDSVDLTVEKFRFSLVRKYFCVRAVLAFTQEIQIVDNWADNLKNVSSRLSGDSVFAVALVGNCARGSCSTYISTILDFVYSDFKVDDFLCKGTHVIGETECVFS
jgi:hypothetical protein